MSPENPLQGPNVYPSTDHLPESWQKELDKFYLASVKAAQATTRCLAKAVSMSQLPAYCEGGETISLMRIFRYYTYS
jgi:isopenicillin N synthase-like dioxygenase